MSSHQYALRPHKLLSMEGEIERETVKVSEIGHGQAVLVVLQVLKNIILSGKQVQGDASVFLICALIKTNPIGRWKESKDWSGFESVNYGVHTPRLKKTLVFVSVLLQMASQEVRLPASED
uniref:Uncharacterized protein n=1 Tax=Timema shepardi TaxID=629360 RepID=A0A7R9G3E8_TIMSH|nr:unnamed protein product [Timema shepardi]